MSRLHDFASFLSRLGVQLSAVLLVYMVGHTVVEIVMRSFFSRSTFALDEFVGYAMAGITFLSLGHTLRQGHIIRVGLLPEVLSGLPRRILEIVAAAATIAVMAFASWFFWLRFLRIFERGEVAATVMGTPLWIPSTLVLLGLVLFLFQLSTYLLILVLGGPIYGEEETVEDDRSLGV